MDTKICKICNIEKNVFEFNKSKKHKSGWLNECKICYNNNHAEYRLLNKDKISEISKKSSKLYREKNRDKVLVDLKNYREKNKEKKNKYYSDYVKNRKKNDFEYKIRVNTRNLIGTSFKRACNGIFIKNKKSENILGCSLDYFVIHIVRLFLDGMTLSNYGEWELDHIIPISSAKNKEEIYKLNHYSNFQPLWKIDNIKKGKTII
jgi:hypothetical protein